MKNNPLYKSLKQTALDGDYTVEQIKNISKAKVCQLLDTEERFSNTFFLNMKRGIIMILQNRDDEKDFQQLKQTAKNWLDISFPGWEAERGREGEKPFVKIWLKGKP